MAPHNWITLEEKVWRPIHVGECIEGEFIDTYTMQARGIEIPATRLRLDDGTVWIVWGRTVHRMLRTFNAVPGDRVFVQVKEITDSPRFGRVYTVKLARKEGG